MRNSGSSCSESVGPPLWLLAELTYRCPLQCPYCSNPLEFAREGAELSTAEWIEVFRQARELGAAQLGFSGGEPLLRQDLAELIEAGRGLGFLQQAAEGAVQRAVGFRPGGAGTGHVLDVAAGAEVPVGAAQHQRPHATVVAHGGEHRAQFADHRQAHGVAALRAVQGDPQDALDGFQQQGLAMRQAHAGFLLERQPFFLPGRMPISLQMMPSMISSAPPPMDTRRVSR